MSSLCDVFAGPRSPSGCLPTFAPRPHGEPPARPRCIRRIVGQRWEDRTDREALGAGNGAGSVGDAVVRLHSGGRLRPDERARGDGTDARYRRYCGERPARPSRLVSGDCPRPAPCPTRWLRGYASSLDHAAWYGTADLWTMLDLQGEVWWALPQGPKGFTQKTFWWSHRFDGQSELEPEISVSGGHLDGAGSSFVAGPPGTNATADFGSSMLVGVEVPTAGCWSIKAVYLDQTLEYVVWLAGRRPAGSLDHDAIPSSCAMRPDRTMVREVTRSTSTARCHFSRDVRAARLHHAQLHRRWCRQHGSRREHHVPERRR